MLHNKRPYVARDGGIRVLETHGSTFDDRPATAEETSEFVGATNKKTEWTETFVGYVVIGIIVVVLFVGLYIAVFERGPMGVVS